MQKINKTRHLIWYEDCECIRRLSAAICNSKQMWNEDKYRCECREDLIGNGICAKGFIWNSSNCECECDKSCTIGQYLDYKSCVCRNT